MGRIYTNRRMAGGVGGRDLLEQEMCEKETRQKLLELLLELGVGSEKWVRKK